MSESSTHAVWEYGILIINRNNIYENKKGTSCEVPFRLF